MPFTAQDLLDKRNKPLAVTAKTLVKDALELMIENDFSQLPIVDENNKPMGIVTSDSILKGLRAFGTSLQQGVVYDVAEKQYEAYQEDDIFDLLDIIKEHFAILIVNNARQLQGIITTYDTTEYFRRRAEDIMLLEDIESAVRDHIEAAFTDQMTGVLNEMRLSTTIKALTGSNNKEFNELTLYQYTRVLLHEDCWAEYGLGFSIDAEHLENMLTHVRHIRNTLAHFRGEITKSQREQLRFCAGWFQRNPPRIPKAAAPIEPTKTLQVDELISHFPTDEELGPNSSRYARLALFLQDRSIDEERLRITFDEIEKIIDAELPPSARQHRSWWANDSVSHVQSIQWLEAGWRVISMNFTEGAVTFARVKEREKSYIEFFNQLVSDLRQTNAFPIREFSPNGVNWVNLVYLPRNNNGQLTCFAYSFAQGRRFRVELYIDLYDQEKNKLVFDQIYSQRHSIEEEIGEALSWERLDSKRASRIALYRHDISITNEKEDLDSLRQWAVDAMIRFEKALVDRAEKAISQIT